MREQFVVIAIDISAPDVSSFSRSIGSEGFSLTRFSTRQFPLTSKNEFYNFDSKPLTERNFDLSKCFKEKDKIQFAVRYNYPLGLGKQLK